MILTRWSRYRGVSFHCSATAPAVSIPLQFRFFVLFCPFWIMMGRVITSKFCKTQQGKQWFNASQNCGATPANIAKWVRTGWSFTQRFKFLKLLKVLSLFSLQTPIWTFIFYISTPILYFGWLICSWILIALLPSISTTTLLARKVGFRSLCSFYWVLFSNVITSSCWCVLDLCGRIRIFVSWLTSQNLPKTSKMFDSWKFFFKIDETFMVMHNYYWV